MTTYRCVRCGCQLSDEGYGRTEDSEGYWEPDHYLYWCGNDKCASYALYQHPIGKITK